RTQLHAGRLRRGLVQRDAHQRRLVSLDIARFASPTARTQSAAYSAVDGGLLGLATRAAGGRTSGFGLAYQRRRTRGDLRRRAGSHVGESHAPHRRGSYGTTRLAGALEQVQELIWQVSVANVPVFNDF